MLIDTIHAASEHVTVLAFNPFENAKPDFGALGGAFGNKTTQIVSIIWGLFMLGAAIWLMRAFGALGAAKTAQNPGAIEGAKSQLTWALCSLIGLSLVAVIYAAVLAFAA